MRLTLLGIVTVLFVTVPANAADKHILDPDFEIATPAGNQVFREELAIALGNTPVATPETRKKFKKDAEKLALSLLRKGEKRYERKRVSVTVYWDSLRPGETAWSDATPGNYAVHLNEIMFFTYHEDYLNLVIPHEIAHLLHSQQWGNPDPNHTETFRWIVEFLSPDYKFKVFDLTVACRLSQRLLTANGMVGSNPSCK